MKNIWKWLFLGLLALLLVCCTVLSVLNKRFHQGEINIIGNRALVSIKQDCYFIKSGEVIEQSRFYMHGYLRDSIWDTAQDHFYGFLEVEAYPVTAEATDTVFQGMIRDGRFLVLTNQHTYLVKEDWQYYYPYVFLFEADTDLITILIKLKDGTTLTGVCADSPEDALDRYQKHFDTYGQFLDSLS